MKKKSDLTLEQQFEKLQKETEAKIKEHMKAALAAVNAAVKLSEKTGIPFYGTVSHLGQNYTPNSFDSKWGELSEDKIHELNDKFGGVKDGGGWAHSDVCW